MKEALKPRFHNERRGFLSYTKRYMKINLDFALSIILIAFIALTISCAGSMSVEEARQVMDQGERMKLYSRLGRILVEEAPIMPLIYGRQHMLVKPWVTRYPVPATGQLFWKDVIIEPH